mgnify:CR=1 FL=1
MRSIEDKVKHLEEQLAAIESDVGEARHILEAGLPFEDLLSAIGTVQVSLESLASVVPSLCGDRCELRLSPDEFCEEFRRTFPRGFLSRA